MRTKFQLQVSWQKCLNDMPFCEGSVSYSERLVEARKIATSRLCNDKEVDEALASAKKHFFANYTNKVGNHYDQEIGRSNCGERHMRWNAYPRLLCFLCLCCQSLVVLRNSACSATTQQDNK